MAYFVRRWPHFACNIHPSHRGRSSFLLPPEVTMMTRRNLLLGASALGAVAPTTQSCSSGSSREQAARSLRRPISANNNRAGLLRELVRYATLAPSSHNTQCWKFRIQERSITIEPDFSRRCPVVDPDDHHLFVSLGCST